MTHRIWVLENSSTDPLQGGWSLKGKLTDPGDHWAIDASVFQSRDHTYMIWSGWAGSANGTQSIYIAELKNPWTLKGDRVKLSQPEYPWEKVGDLNMKRDLNRNPGTDIQDPLHIDVNEGPEILKHDGKIFLIYSASACWTDQYELGMLTASESADLLNATSWQKNKLPVFWESPEAQAYGTGHNAFFKSPDGKQDWIIYHANPAPGEGCGSHRSPRIQPFGWNSDGTPNFGRPVPLDQALPRPSGEVSNR